MILWSFQPLARVAELRERGELVGSWEHVPHSPGEVIRRAYEEMVAAMERAGIQLIRFLVVDGGVPVDAVAFGVVLDALLAKLQAGERVVVACRGGLGRTGTLVACLLIEAGIDGEAAIDLTRRTRPKTIENADQEAFVRAWQ